MRSSFPSVILLLLYAQYGCSQTTTCSCPALQYLNQTDVDSHVGVTVDTTQKAVFFEGISQLECSSGSQFAFIAGGTFFVNNWWMTCDSGSGGWRVRDAYGGNGAYENVPVGCVKPTCTGMLLFDGSEPLLAAHPLYTFVPTRPSYVNGQWGLVCPSDSSIGYAQTPTKFVFDTTMKITCEATGWWVRAATNAGAPLAPVKIGCFRKSTTTPSPAATCSAVNYLSQTDVTSYVGVTVDTTQKAIIVAGLNQLTCSTGTQYASIAGGALSVKPSWMNCAGSANGGWRVRELDGTDNTYNNEPVGCIKPTCTGMQLFDGSEALLASKPQYKFVATLPSYVNGKWALVCPSDSAIGYAQTPTKFVFDTTMKITCETTGWWVRAATNAGAALAPVKIGCFRPVLPACPASFCKACADTLITTATTGSGTFDPVATDLSGTCAVRRYVCKGTPGIMIDVNNGAYGSIFDDQFDGENDGMITVDATCNAAGTAWEIMTVPITSLNCVSTPFVAFPRDL